MTDSNERPAQGGDWGTGSGGTASEPGGGEPGGGQAGGSASGPAASAQQFLSQLQAMIDNIASQSVPVIREVGAKAAELAAIAADRAGPFAQRAAEKTQEVGARVAERSRSLAEDLRRSEARDEGDAASGGGTGAPDEPDTTAPSGPTI